MIRFHGMQVEGWQPETGGYVLLHLVNDSGSHVRDRATAEAFARECLQQAFEFGPDNANKKGECHGDL